MQTVIEPSKSNDILVSPPVTINIPFETLLVTIDALSDGQKLQIYQIFNAKFAPHSAEVKTIVRLPDQDDPTKLHL